MSAWRHGHAESPDATLRHHAAWVAAFGLVVPVQASLVPVVSIGGTMPDLPLLAVLLFALRHSPAASAGVGAVLGTTLDVVSAGSGPFHLPVYAALATVASSVGRLTANLHALTVLAVSGLGSLALGVAQVVWGTPFDRSSDVVAWLVTVLVPQTLYNTAVAWGVFAVWAWRTPPPRGASGERNGIFSAGRFQGSLR